MGNGYNVHPTVEPRPTRAFTATPGQPVTSSAAAWTGKELEASNAWRFMAEEREIGCLVDLARNVADGLNDDPNKLLTMRADAFDLGPFSELLRDIVACVRGGPGVALYRGLPLHDLTLLEAAIIYWGIGQHWVLPNPTTRKAT